jgi:hypothetical protein
MLSSPNKLEDDERIVASLAEETSVAIDAVAQMYHRERAALETKSRIKAFCTVFAIRHVREMLRRRALQQPAPTAARQRALV